MHWWLSFADPALPPGTQFLGACIVGPASDMAEACKLAWWLGISPGGQVMGKLIRQPIMDATPNQYIGRLLTREECSGLDTLWFANVPPEGAVS